MTDPRIEERLARYIEQREADGRRLDPRALCDDAPELSGALRKCIEEYELLAALLGGSESAAPGDAGTDEGLPRFEGFRTIERLGGGGGGEVFKLEDLELGRTVAGKIVRAEGPLRASVADFVREARSLALFDDRRIVTIHEFRGRAEPPLLVMEYVDGFELGRIGPSLEYAQRARVMLEVAEAIDHAHRRGIQHRDLKPSNVMLDAKLTPKILDFGLSRGEPDRGHRVGTPGYMAPEQLHPDRPIDARSDVYALGVMLYELLCGRRPYDATTSDELVREIERATPRLPVEIEPDVPEPLQAIALKAMERSPDERYTTAGELAAELRRYLDGRPVLARPTLYPSALERRVLPHLEQIREWLRIRLIHPHEAERLRRAYAGLQLGDEDWIVRGRSLSFSHIALYLGAWLIVAGGLLYFGAYLFDAVDGLLRPTLVLGAPFVGLNLSAHLLRRSGRSAIAIAFQLGAVVLLPMYLLVLFGELDLWPAPAGDPYELLGDGLTSNRQLQLAALAACGWSAWLALRSRTIVLSACFAGLLCLLHLAVLLDFGLRPWLEDGQWHRLAGHLAPLVVLAAGLARTAERRRAPWLAQPLYFTAAGLLVVVLELVALRGKAFELLGLSMAPFQAEQVARPWLLDTLTAMTLNGLLIYAVAGMLDRYGSRIQRDTAWLLFVISPFAVLQPIAYLSGVGEYARRYDWIYLTLALLIAALSHYRQRRSFYYAGLLNTAVALWFISGHYEWFDRPGWAVAVGAVGLALLLAGVGLHARERRRPGPH